ncbi:glycosyltransferase family 4 protein [Chthonobacter albigriseus]|uniref:glycosyltransferase family 4 protein n=1 Tax=Chthonobacter albigriseus TaxID=1683161 RepID=UPI0015EE8F08|nr:glycosyltransferase family 1 protein [Chthonobacter albigriseus]
MTSGSGERVVAIDVRMWRNSGIGVHLRNIVPRLVSARPDWTFRLIAGPSFDEVPDGRIEVRTISAGIYSVREQVEVARAAAGAAVVWSPHYNAPILAPAPLAVTIHDVSHLVVQQGFGVAKKLYAKALFAAVRRRASALMFVSDFSRREFSDVVGPPRQPTFLTPNAVGEAWLAAGAGGPPPRSGRYAVVIGNLKPNKNLPRLMTAFQAVAASSDLDMVVIGRRDGLLTGDEGVAAAAAALGDRVQFTGFVSDTALVDWVRHATLLVMPSYHEGFGIPPLEAMAVGCPTVVSDIGAHRESCGEASLFVDPASPQDIARGILAVAGDPALADDLRRRGRVQARRFTWDASAETVAEALEGTMAGRHAQPAKPPRR